MSLSEAAVIFFGLFAGYWVVSKLFFRSPPARKSPVAAAQVAAPQSQSPWYEVLQVDPMAPVAVIHRAYRELISLYHPDKVATLGPEIRELAGRKSQAINMAYSEALRARGEVP